MIFLLNITHRTTSQNRIQVTAQASEAFTGEKFAVKPEYNQA